MSVSESFQPLAQVISSILERNETWFHQFQILLHVIRQSAASRAHVLPTKLGPLVLLPRFQHTESGPLGGTTSPSVVVRSSCRPHGQRLGVSRCPCGKMPGAITDSTFINTLVFWDGHDVGASRRRWTPSIAQLPDDSNVVVRQWQAAPESGSCRIVAVARW